MLLCLFVCLFACEFCLFVGRLVCEAVLARAKEHRLVIINARLAACI